MTTTILEAKTNRSELIPRVQGGQQVIITSGREKTPVAELKAIEPIAQKRLGFLHYLNLNIPDSAFFEDLPEDGLKLWEGDRE